MEFATLLFTQTVPKTNQNLVTFVAQVASCSLNLQYLCHSDTNEQYFTERSDGQGGGGVGGSFSREYCLLRLTVRLEGPGNCTCVT